MESSVGCHSTDVMGARCHVKDATGVGSGAEVLGKACVNSDRDQQTPSCYSPAFLHVSQIPYFYLTFVTTTKEQICGTATPADHVDVARMCRCNGCDAFPSFTPHIPHPYALVCGARRENCRLAWTPLYVFDTRSVRGKWRILRGETRRRACRQVDLGMDVSSKQTQCASIGCSPVHRKALGAPVGFDGILRLLRALLVRVRTRSIKSVHERAHVPDVHLASLGPAGDVIWLRWRR